LPDESGRNAERVVEYAYEKALSGHFGFFKLLIDVVDGKLRQTAEEELTFEAACTIVPTDDERGTEHTMAA
jgi:hypothetical protein